MDRAGIAREGAQSHASARTARRIQPFTIIRDDVIARLGACVSDKAFKLYVLVAHGRTPARFAHWDAEVGAFEIPLDSFAALLKCSRDTARRARNELVRNGFWILRRPGRGQALTMYQFNPRDWHYVCSQRVERRAIHDAPLNAGMRGSKRAPSEVATVLPRGGWRSTPEFEAAQRDADEVRAERGLSKMHERYLAACSPSGELDRSAPSARPGEAEADGAYGASELNGRAKPANGRGDARYARAPRAPDASDVLSEREGVVRQTILAKLRDAAAYIELKQQRHPQWKTLWIDETLIAEATALVRRTSLDRFVDTCAAFVERVERVDTLRARKSIADGAGYLRSMLRLREGAWPNAHRRTPAGRAKR